MGAGNRIRLFGAAAIALLPAGPLLADVKDGVDAWGRGDYEAAVREWIGPAGAGDADALFNLAQAYRLGRGVDTDLAMAETLYARAAAQGHLRAADNYGLLLFQNDKREQAMPYIEAAARRGDPRAQYLLGLAHFNGDLAAKDWPRAYALLTLANATGLPQARRALAQMDEYVPLAERQAAQALAAQLKADAEAARASELAAIDLAIGSENDPVVPLAEEPSPRAPAARSSPVVVARLPATQPAAAPPAAVAARTDPVAAEVRTPEKAPVRRAAFDASPRTGPWKVQLGVFGVPSNVERMWAKVSKSAPVAGYTKVTEPAGRLTVLYAAGYASRADANAACAALKRAGNDCLVTR
ncbi:SPOR domain-containing protein [Qipengyuania sp. XHP0207]|uniref:SPOR domain-containing protein n=1 Tax=Qipengyuania sp. XHP0207 TaxID=3038078 RepID=UPI00241C166B|nr:SPOR domain-containing protein [Qipengyuania sp. XHP0207]MDG5749145.1 SPOR domain-containing protein [Qipengyuania sp. XHP0207]